MTAVAASSTAMAAIWNNATALQAVKNNTAAWATFTGASSAVMGKTVAILAGLNPDSYANMTAVAASSTAMTAVAASSTAMAAVVASTTACQAIEASTTAIAAMNAAPGFTEAAGQTCQANSSMSTTLINSKAWVSEYWNSSTDANTGITMLIGVHVVGGGSTNIGNLSVARTRQKVNKFVSSVRIATTYGSALAYGGIRYKTIS